MDRRQQAGRVLYVVLVGDAVLRGVFLALSQFLNLMPVAAIGHPTLLISNVWFLRRKLNTVDRTPTGDEPVTRSSLFSLYAGSFIFFLGTLYGLLLIASGLIPLGDHALIGRAAL